MNSTAKNAQMPTKNAPIPTKNSTMKCGITSSHFTSGSHRFNSGG